MNQLILVKHSQPDIVPNVSAKEWHLSPTGQARCNPLAEKLTAFSPDVFFSSTEPKAIETAQLAAEQMNVSSSIVQGLHEHDRTGVGYLAREQFESSVKNFFGTPDRLVFGNETANQAFERFSQAVKTIELENPDKHIVIVAHGTVISLFVSRYNAIAPFLLWERLGLPSFVVLSQGQYELIKTVESIV